MNERVGLVAFWESAGVSGLLSIVSFLVSQSHLALLAQHHFRVGLF